ALAAILAFFWPLDRTPPVVRIDPPPGRYNEKIKVTLTSEAGADLFIAVGEAQPVPYLEPVQIRRSTTIRYFGRDRFGNLSAEAQAGYQVRTDSTPPVSVASPRGGKYFHPVSVRLKTEEGGVIHYTTDGSEPALDSEEYKAPVPLRRDTTLRFFAVDEAGNAEESHRETYRISLDSTRPVTLAEPSGGLFREPVVVRLSAEKGTVVYYTIDGSRPTTRSPRYEKPVRFVRSGVLRFFAVDQAGNRESVREESYIIDGQPPNVRASPAPGAYPDPVTVLLKSDERGEIRYELGGEATLSSPVYKAPVELTRTATLSYLALDEAGNVSPAIEARYIIDTVAPEAVTRPPGGSYSGRIRVKIEPSEPADIYYTLDGSVPTDSSMHYKGPITINKNTTLSFFAVDKVGNRGAVSSQRYILDSTPPKTVAEPAGGTFSGEVNVSLRTEEGAVTRYTLDGMSPSEASRIYEKPLHLVKDTQLKFYSTDSSGNREDVQVENYIFDTTPPSTTVKPPPGYYSKPISVTLSSEKEGRIFLRRQGKEDFEVYKGPFIVSRTEKLSFYFVDVSGNNEPAQVVEFIIDTVPPKTVPYPAPGQYNPPITLELTTEKNAVVHYTRDGTEPTLRSPVYKSPLALNDDVTLKYFAIDSAGNRERTRSGSYTVASGIWRDNSSGVFIHPSVIDGDYIWIGGEEGLFRVRIDNKRKKIFTTFDGLISNSVRAIAVDRLGFKWIGTDKGLSQFDGDKNWVTYDYSDGLPSNLINCVVIDPRDDIWIGTDKGLAHYDRKRFTVRTIANGLPDNNITSLAIDANGVFWIGTSKGLLRLDGKNLRVFTMSDGLPSNRIMSVAVDGRWNIWAGTEGSGIAMYDGNNWVRYTGARGFPNTTVRVIVPDLADNKWFGTDAGVYKYDGRVFTKSETEIYR
ncbi:MAG: chitobiase/beta-hexosaminidase C-terminal domain-containing protein, partial [Pseudomonadota bacterium]